jgi:hypothetical protein
MPVKPTSWLYYTYCQVNKSRYGGMIACSLYRFWGNNKPGSLENRLPGLIVGIKIGR